MSLERRIAAGFRMSDDVWDRHANPWSVWTRFTALPLLVLAFWSRVWIGAWAALPVAAALIWTWLNPRLFPPPRSTDSWASKAVLGERVWLNRAAIPVPSHHRRVPNILSAVSAIGGVLVIWGVAALAVWPTMLGMAIVYLSKLWFVDRMVWLYDEMRHDVPEYASWLRRR